MADDIKIIPAGRQQLSQVEAWSARNDAVKTLLKTPRDPSTGLSSSSWHWAALLKDEVVAVATVELNKEHVGYISCIVKPGYQRRGIGSHLFEYALSQPEVKDLMHLHAVVEPANVAARKVLNSHGFSRVGYDDAGRIEFARHHTHHAEK
jgi:ribosomal protein S18 acetylase RimI-like enzyme